MTVLQLLLTCSLALMHLPAEHTQRSSYGKFCVGLYPLPVESIRSKRLGFLTNVKLRFPQGTATIYHPTKAVKSAVANKNTSKNCESGFCQTKMKHLPTILAVVQQQNLKLNQLLLAANSEE